MRHPNAYYFLVTLLASLSASATAFAAAPAADDGPPKRPLRIDPAPIASDPSVKYDYDIVYVRAPRSAPGKDGRERQADVWPNAEAPTNLRASTDLMLLHPDGTEQVLVEG